MINNHSLSNFSHICTSVYLSITKNKIAYFQALLLLLNMNLCRINDIIKSTLIQCKIPQLLLHNVKWLFNDIVVFDQNLINFRTLILTQKIHFIFSRKQTELIRNLISIYNAIGNGEWKKKLKDNLIKLNRKRNAYQLQLVVVVTVVVVVIIIDIDCELRNNGKRKTFSSEPLNRHLMIVFNSCRLLRRPQRQRKRN